MSDAPAKKGLPAPQSAEAEASLLGGLMLDRSAFIDVDGLLKPADFYQPQHRVIFEAIESLARADQPFDIVTVHEALVRFGAAEEAGGLPYLGGLTRDTPGASNALSYAKIVKDRALRRELIDYGRRLAALAMLGFEREELDAMQAEILNLTSDRMTRGPVQVYRDIGRYLDELDARGKRGDRLIGPSSGFEDIDKITLGLEPGTLWYIGARPSMGKTALALKIAERCSIARSDPGLFFSAEMPADQLYDRLFANMMPSPMTDVRSGQLSDSQWEAITRAQKKLHERPLYIDDTQSIHVHEIRARARRVHQRAKLKYIIVDYLQLLDGPGKDDSARVSYVSKHLKGLAKELNVCLICLAQLNREVEKRDSKRPYLSDLRDSGSIEQDGDVIGFLWVDDTKRPYRNLSFDKNRNGPKGDVQLSWSPNTVTFDDVDHQQQIEWGQQEQAERDSRKPKRRARNPLGGADKRAGTDN